MDRELIKIVEYSYNDLSSIEASWKKLENGIDMTFFQSFTWICLCSKEIMKLKNNIKLVYFAIYKGNKIKIIFPAEIHYQNSRKKKQGIYLIGEESISDYLNIIYDEIDQACLIELMDYIKFYYKLPIFMNRILENTQIAPILQKVSFNAILGAEKAVELPSCNSSNELDILLSKHTKQNLRTARNRLKKANLSYEVKIKIGPLDAEDVHYMTKMYYKRFYSKFIKKQTSVIWKLKYLCSLAKKVLNHMKFDIFEEALQISDSFCIQMFINGHFCGFLGGGWKSNCAYIMRVSYDERYEFYSPIMIALFESLSKIIPKMGIHVKLDMTRGDENYKLKLGGIVKKLNNYEL